MVQVHGTAVEVDGVGVLLLGPSGSGKSDLALRLIDGGARLVADDRTNVVAKEGRLEAFPPREIKGLLEVRGVGLLAVESLVQGRLWTHLGLAIELVAAERVERLPEPAGWECLGVTVPCLALAPFEASAAAKVRLAVRGVKDGIIIAAGSPGK